MLNAPEIRKSEMFLVFVCIAARDETPSDIPWPPAFQTMEQSPLAVLQATELATLEGPLAVIQAHAGKKDGLQ